MDLSAAQHQLHHHYLHQQHQEMGNSNSDSQSLDSIIACSKPLQNQITPQQQDQKKPRPPENEPQKCPRCDSTNTKFCYYNNYSLTQPRYFCKSCRRYWTKGGTLRNVPVGGGCRRSNKRSSSVTSSPSPSHSSFLIKRPHNYDATMTSLNPVFPFPASYGGLGFESAALGNGNGTDCDGMFSNGVGYLHHNAGSGGLFQSLCYGNNSVSGVSDEMNLASNVMPTFEDVATGTTATTSAVTVTTMKQEDGRALWGFPWQVMNYGESVGDIENIRGSNWNGLIGNTAWHGLLNTPALI